MADQPTAVQVLDLGDLTVLGVVGDLDHDAADRVDLETQKALARDASIIVLDCSLLRSLGLEEAAVLSSVNDRVRGCDRRFVLRQPSARTCRLLARSGAHDLEVEPD